MSKQFADLDMFDNSKLENDPMAAIFELNLGDFLTEHLISKDLASKIKTSSEGKIPRLKNQLRELISIYSINNTLNILGLNQKDDYLIYNSIASSLTQMLDVKVCHILLTNKLIPNFDNKQNDFILCGTSNERLSDDITNKDLGLKFDNLIFLSSSFIIIKLFPMFTILFVGKRFSPTWKVET